MTPELRPRPPPPHTGTARPTQEAPAGLSEWPSQVSGPELRASRCWCRASSPEPRLGRSGSNRLPSSTTRLRRSSSCVTLCRHQRSPAGHRARAGVREGDRAPRRHSRGVGILQEAKLVPLAVWAQRLHDGQDAGRGERCCRVEGWGTGGGRTPSQGTGEGRGGRGRSREGGGRQRPRREV